MKESINTAAKTANRQNIGAFANDLLSDAICDKIVYDIFYVKRFKPTQETITNFKPFTSERLNKPKGSELILEEITVPNKTIHIPLATQCIADLQANSRK